MLVVSAGSLGGLLALLLVLALANEVLQNELIMVDFRQGVEPFEVGEGSAGTFDRVEGTYRLMVKHANAPATSVGELVRTAYAVGIRAEVETIEPGTTVGVMCLGPTAEGSGQLAGYGLFIESGGHYVVGRLELAGRIEFLKQGEAGSIDEPRRLSVVCVPGENGDVLIIGYVNTMQLVTATDPGGYDQYTHAGLTLVADQAGGQVRFTRVSARVPDEEWVP